MQDSKRNPAHMPLPHASGSLDPPSSLIATDANQLCSMFKFLSAVCIRHSCTGVDHCSHKTMTVMLSVVPLRMASSVK